MISVARIVRAGISDLGQLKQALQLAMQLEFSTLPPYLCAEWSVDPSNDPDKVMVTINGIAEQEMYHFALAGNMLTAIGGTPMVATPDFIPTYPTHELPGGIAQKLAVDLQPLSKSQLEVFLQIENPEFPPVALALAKRPTTIGAFYDTIYAGFDVVKPAIVSGAPQVKVGEVFPITSIADAKTAINLIKGEGEGTEGNPDQPPPNATKVAHYYAFKEILKGNKLVFQAGQWGFSGDPVRFPSVFNFKPAPAGSKASDKFSKILTQLLTQLETCWKTPGVRPAVGMMFDLQTEGENLIQQQGIRPEFVWST